ncbi:type I-G CRISPR-associated helicase/endonuclease Cas3g [Paraburkholderia sp. MM5482-R1]|uniref:type I-G CRISPR-associated helicase/endonuclease Cas3g n=1 Tax=unclassified Paraburkholderia TaxID=2615204 RepID=UPI003D1D86C4
MSPARTFLSLLLKHMGIGEPYIWQREAYCRLCAGEAPSQIKAPTASGKTMMIAIFVASLATQAANGRVTLARRLVYVINRRVLVDEASALAERILHAINTEEDLRPLRDALAGLSASGKALAVSTLRGQLEDNGEWSRDPSTPAIILATPDMLGSRLLFRGYGVGRSRGATHAGLLGCDTFIVHDEAHLAPAFTFLLRQIEALAGHGAAQIGRPALRVIEMTATPSGAFGLPLVCDVASDPALATRMSASKLFRIADASLVGGYSGKPGDAVVEGIAIVATAMRDENRAVAIFVSSPASADKIADRLRRSGIAPDRITTLTGTIRGHERAKLVDTPAFRRCDPGPNRTLDGTAYFIATSAGEIGLDIDADVGLFDMTTLERFIQRAGRVNRRGYGHGYIILVHAHGLELPEAIRERGLKALRLLERATGSDWIGDASPLALNRLCDLPDYADAIEPAPAMRDLEPAIVDMMSMTSLRLHQLGCPAPDIFIHGLVDEDADLALVWRDLPDARADFTEWLDVWPISPREVARVPIDVARRLLNERLVVTGTEAGETVAVALDAQGLPVPEDPRLTRGARANRWIARLRPGSVVLLSKVVRGLTGQGIPSATSVDPVLDVSTGFTDVNGMFRQAIRQLHVTAHLDEEGTVWRHEDLTAPSLETLLQAAVGEHEIVFHDGPRVIEAADWSGKVTIWLSDKVARTADAGDFASLGPRDRLLVEHHDLTARAARRLCIWLDLPPPLAAAEIRAAAEHDRGKAWGRWQRAIGNVDPNRVLGKSAKAAFDFKINDGYRHELGSLVACGETMTQLERHLIAAHHGWSRPMFPDRALAKPGCAAAALAAAPDFAVVHQALGPWALCYLEAVLKSADVLAETLDASLVADPAIVLPAAAAWPTISTPSAEAFLLPVDPTNFGEYLAALGLASLAITGGVNIRLGWADGCMVLSGIGRDGLLSLLDGLRGAVVQPDERASVKTQRGAKYPPLRLGLKNHDFALNHWLDARLRGSSEWKLGAGQTTAAGTLLSVAKACADSLDLPDFDPVRIFAIGGARVGADASKFRFDAATNWSARNAGFSLNENERFKSTRPWVELLSALGLQYFFLPPSDSITGYSTWQGELLPPVLTLAAVRGLLPECDARYKLAIERTGKATKDVFASQPVIMQRKPPWPGHFTLI